MIHPTKLIVRVQRGTLVSKPALVDMDRFDELIAKANLEFGDPTKPMTGPEMPKVEPRRKGKRW